MAMVLALGVVFISLEFKYRPHGSMIWLQRAI